VSAVEYALGTLFPWRYRQAAGMCAYLGVRREDLAGQVDKKALERLAKLGAFVE
jgi:hypothetical protein